MQQSHSPPLRRLLGKQVEILLTQQAWFHDENYTLLFYPDDFLRRFLTPVKKIMGWLIGYDDDHQFLISPLSDDCPSNNGQSKKSLSIPRKYVGEIYELIRRPAAIAV